MRYSMRKSVFARIFEAIERLAMVIFADGVFRPYGVNFTIVEQLSNCSLIGKGAS